jgi:hypothetical protein
VLHATRLTTSGTFIHGNHRTARSVSGNSNAGYGCVGWWDVDTPLGLERPRGGLRTGLARIEGAVSLLVHHSEQTEKAQEQQVQRLDHHETRLDLVEAVQQTTADLPGRMRAVERRLWAIGGGIATIMAVAELLVYLLH